MLPGERFVILGSVMKRVFHTLVMVVMFGGLVLAIALSTHSTLARLQTAPRRDAPAPVQAGGGFGIAIPANR